MKRRSILVGALSLFATPAIAALLPLETVKNARRYVGAVINDENGNPRWILAKNVQTGDLIMREQFLEIYETGEIGPIRANHGDAIPGPIAAFCNATI